MRRSITKRFIRDSKRTKRRPGKKTGTAAGTGREKEKARHGIEAQGREENGSCGIYCHRFKAGCLGKTADHGGPLTPCKLVAIIPANKTYIFANRAGLKVAEYTASQLAHMIVTENSEILDTGAEFESALATVVTGLREDKNKSFDELTGGAE